MSTPSSEIGHDDSTSSSLHVTHILEANANDNSSTQLNDEIHNLLEKQLLMEKTRVGQLTNDNQRLLSQNISLCQAIKQQKTEIVQLKSERNKLQQQVSRLFLTVNTLNKTHKQNSEKDAALQQSLKHEFDVLKQAVMDKGAEVTKLKTVNQTFDIELRAARKEISRKSDEVKELNEKLVEIERKHLSEIQEYKSTISAHLKSFQEFNHTIKSLNATMKSKEEEMESTTKQNAELRQLSDSQKQKLEELSQENSEDKEKLEQQNQEICELKATMQRTQSLYEEATKSMDAERAGLEETVSEKEAWKSEAMSMHKECEYNVRQIRELRSKLNAQLSSSYGNKANLDVYVKQCRLLQWKRFVEYAVYQRSMERVHEVWMYLKQKYIALNQKYAKETGIESGRVALKGKENKQPPRKALEDSFKISMYKSLKDIKSLDLDRLLLCQDIRELKQFLVSSELPPSVQLKVAASLIPVVENYRVELQKDINQKLDKLLVEN